MMSARPSNSSPTHLIVKSCWQPAHNARRACQHVGEGRATGAVSEGKLLYAVLRTVSVVYPKKILRNPPVPTQKDGAEGLLGKMRATRQVRRRGESEKLAAPARGWPCRVAAAAARGGMRDNAAAGPAPDVFASGSRRGEKRANPGGDQVCNRTGPRRRRLQSCGGLRLEPPFSTLRPRAWTMPISSGPSEHPNHAPCSSRHVERALGRYV